MGKPLRATEIKTALAELPGWATKRDALEKTFTFTTFREAMSFMVGVAFEAESRNHHPDWRNVYNRVVVRLTTHDAGSKVTAKDVALAQSIELIAWVKQQGGSRTRPRSLSGTRKPATRVSLRLVSGHSQAWPFPSGGSETRPTSRLRVADARGTLRA